MPLTIRQLPAKSVSPLVTASKFPKNVTFFNPSRAGRYIYIRSSIHVEQGETNRVVINDTELGQAHCIESPLDALQPTVNLFTGIEDLRIAEFHGRLWFSGTCTHASEHQINDLIVGCFDAELTRVERVQAVDIGSRPVKNVCAFVHDDRLCLLDVFFKRIYVVENTDDADAPLKAVLYRDLRLGAGIALDGIRGSTSPVHLHGNLWGCVVHDIIYRNNRVLVTRLAYIHHWMEFDIATGLITYVSTPFYIAHWGIEYVSGLHLDASGQVHLYFGVEDRAAYTAVTTLTDLKIGF